MANLTINEQDANRLRNIAQRENRPLEEVISRMIDDYASRTEQDSLTDWRRDYRAKLYTEAREYWKNANDIERFALSDAQLDEQFWCFDRDGIPRLKSDQDKITLPPNGLLALAETAEREGFAAEESEIDYRKILNEEFPEYLLRRMQDNNGD